MYAMLVLANRREYVREKTHQAMKCEAMDAFG
jgi:hypothetical protein